MNYGGFFFVHRQLFSSSIWDYDGNTLKLFLYLIGQANITDKIWRGMTIKRGQYVGSRSKLSLGTGLSEQNIRTCLKNLKEIDCITIESTNKISIITILNYDTYQPQIKNINQLPNQQINQEVNQQDNQLPNQQTNHPTNHNYINNNINNNTQQEITNNKNLFLKNGTADEKKVFSIEEIKAALAAEGITMTENGYVEFKALNEGENGYGYKGGIIRSAQNFLQKPMNQKYSLAKENNGKGKGKGKNTPPTPPQPPQASTDKQVLAVWENVKNAFREQMSLMDYKSYIENNAQCYPIKYENGIIDMYYGTMQTAETFFRLHRDWLDGVKNTTGVAIRVRGN